jgi:hypothetical protein
LRATATSKVTRLALYALLGLLFPLCVIGFFFPDVVGLVNLAAAAIATMGPIFTARLIWEHRCHSEGSALTPPDRLNSLAIPVISATLSILPLILFISSLHGWPGQVVGGLSLLVYAILQCLAVTRAWRAYQSMYLARHTRLPVTPAV